MKKEYHAQRTNNQNKQNARHTYRLFAILVIVMFLLVTYVCVWFYGKLQTTIHQESSSYLTEVSVRIEYNITRIIDDTYSMLYSTSRILEERPHADFEDLDEISGYQQQYWNYQRMLLVDEYGSAFDTGGRPISISDGAFLQDTVEQGQASMSSLQVVDDQECFIFAVPLDRRMIDGVTMAALAVTYDTDILAPVLSMSAFSNLAYSHIVSRDGTILISSDSPSKAAFGTNVLSSIQHSQSVSHDQMELLRTNILEGKTGQTEFSFEGRKEYMVYHPISSTDWILLTFVPAEVVNAKSNLLLTISMIVAGFIVLAFSVLVLILLASFRRHRQQLEQIAYVDQVTGGNTIERFYQLAQLTLQSACHPSCALIYTNFGKFKILNEKFGRNACDEILCNFYNLINQNLETGECIGRLSADNFCILVQSNQVEQICQRFETWYRLGRQQMTAEKPVWTWPLMEFGIYLIKDTSLPFPQMIDRAKLALRESPRSLNSKLRYAVYNDEVRSLLFREKHLEDMMEHALISGEFQMYLQPKYRVADEQIIGAEALSRWISPTEGMIYPDEFIPLFEKNGFIIQLDLWVFEQVCITLHRWISQGKAPIKISVNCSRAHLRDTKFLQSYLNLAETYNVSPSLIEIELTESIVLEDGERFKRVVEEIHQSGFGCSMDDFGSGYSSLNMLQDITVDTLKLDQVFFRNASKNAERTESVVSNIVGMAKALSMVTVAEGVEYQEQVQMLRRIGCEIIQGYIFAKPMPIEEFEQKWNGSDGINP